MTTHGSADARGPELTVRGLALGAALTLLFTAANVYLGLKVGLTFATSIPAAVISMAVLRLVRDAGILENNIVQTVASAAGTLAAIIFVLPGLVMLGWWADFPFWQTFGVCACGGILGVMFSIPLRRALVTGSDLPFPEGVAAAEVLKVGTARHDDAEGRTGLAAILLGTAMSAGFAALAAARVFVGEVATWFRLGAASTGISAGLSFALMGAGHLVGLSVGMAMFAGLILAFGIATPLLSALHGGAGPAEEVALTIWSQEVRFIGAGVIGVAALWTLARLMRPIWRGLREAAAASRDRKAQSTLLPLEERDIPIGIVGAVVAALMIPIAILLFDFLRTGPLAPLQGPLIAASLVYILLSGAFVASVCGYMAGLIGASNSPLSGVGILAIIGAALLLAIVAVPFASPDAQQQLIAFALFVTGIIFAAATISNDNLQDLKTGQLVGATPWKQQVALVVGVLAGAAVIPPVLDLLNQAYGFAGAVPATAGSAGADALPAPQATLITALARGVLGGDLDWSLIGIGAIVGVVLLAIDGLLGRRGWLRLPPLAVGIGIYLPMSATLPVVIGAVIGHLYERRHSSDGARRTGVLLASGFIVGESLFGVLLAGLIVATGSSAPLALGDGLGAAAVPVGLASFTLLVAFGYRWISARSAGFARQG